MLTPDHVDYTKALFLPIFMANKTGIEIMNFSGAEALLLGQLPLHHRDPFGRMIIAQSIARKFHLMSDNAKFLKYDCRVI